MFVLGLGFNSVCVVFGSAPSLSLCLCLCDVSADPRSPAPKASDPISVSSVYLLCLLFVSDLQ